MLTLHPEWRAQPVAVVDEDRPSGLIREVNAAARRGGVLPGQRYATALGLCRELRAGVVLPATVARGVAHLARVLRAFTPDLEAAPDVPGVFWLDASGLTTLFSSMEVWARALLESLKTEGFEASLALGFTRFGVQALARRLSIEAGDRPDASRLLLCEDAADETRIVAAVPLRYLHLKPSVRDRLDRLGVRTVGDLVALPAVGLLKRYGRDIHDLHRAARAEMPLHFQADRPPESFVARIDFDHPIHDAMPLLFHVKSLVDGIIPALAARDLWVEALLLQLGHEKSKRSHAAVFETHVLRPAAPGLDVALLLELVRLRLEGLDLRAGLIALQVELVPGSATHDQARLFRQQPHCDPALAAQALAKVRAELGEEAVGRFRLRAGHLPRASFVFEPLQAQVLTAPDGSPDEADGAPPGFVRRLHPQPVPLPTGVLGAPDATRLPEPRAPFVRLFGPWIISGGWWAREVQRTYAWGETSDGALLWLFWDGLRRAWFEEGRLA
jgi:protein ImuB